MSKFVDKVKKSGETYEIHDARLEVTAEDAGKMVAVDEEGELSLVDAPSSGKKFYQHSIGITATIGESQSTPQNIIVITDSNSPFEYKTQGGPPRIESSGNIISILDFGTVTRLWYNIKAIKPIGTITSNGTITVFDSVTFNSDTVTEL